MIKERNRRVPFTKEKHMRKDIVWWKLLGRRLLSTHMGERWSPTFLCLRKSGGKSPTVAPGWCKHTHTHAHTHTHTHTHLPFRQNMAPHLFPHLSTRNECRSLPLLFLFRLSRSSSFSPSFPLSPSPFSLYSARSKRSHTDARIPTHKLLCPVASLAISLPLSLSLSLPLTHTASQLPHCRKLLCDPPTLCFPPRSLSASLNISPPRWQSPPHLSAPSVLRGRSPVQHKTPEAAVNPWLMSLMHILEIKHKPIVFTLQETRSMLLLRQAKNQNKITHTEREPRRGLWL